MFLYYCFYDEIRLFACAKKRKFAKILSEMKKILFFVANLLVCIGVSDAAVRDGTGPSRTLSSTQSRISTTPKRTTSARTTTLSPRSNVGTARNAVATRSATTSGNITSRSATPRNNNDKRSKNIAPERSATTGVNISETRTGAEYERCKSTYFSCMDQFCTLKNDDYRRCSCNDRVFDMISARETLDQAGTDLNTFTENLSIVGMTATQASAMRQESEGESALTSDNSASKALLQAIINSIRGDDSSVSGKYSPLNSINISFDTANAFGTTDIGQAIAGYNGRALYNAVYPQCRNAVKADCNDASLQRAITAYLMAIEQDCNTVQTAIEKTQQDLKAAVREGGAMLGLARVENRQKHNSSTLSTCINEIEQAILSEEVCGANYHKCLDNGEYIDISTGKPIAGVEDFYKLEQMLTFSTGVDAAYQQLSKTTDNRPFVQNFENRVKKFAEPAMDKCVEDADVAWSEYLDKAMLAIYYAQKDKVAEIKQNCFDYVAQCYMNSDSAITNAMSDVSSDNAVVLQPDKIALNSAVCQEYVDSCNNMFADDQNGNIIAQYIAARQDTDTLTACRAIVKQCFDKYGGVNYENFFYPYSGLFTTGAAGDWFTLYNEDGEYVSECAKQLRNVTACSDPDMIERAFGGFDKAKAKIDGSNTAYKKYITCTTDDTDCKYYYGMLREDNDNTELRHRMLRSSGVATEVYNNILSVLSTQCMNLQGRFIEPQAIPNTYTTDNTTYSCKYKLSNDYTTLTTAYNIKDGENMCPHDYELSVDIESWGICSCWENGARRSKDGASNKCMATLPVDAPDASDKVCNNYTGAAATNNINKYCTQTTITLQNQICPLGYNLTDDRRGCINGDTELQHIPEGI